MISKNFFKNINDLAKETDLTKVQIQNALKKSLIYGCRKSFKVKTCFVDFQDKLNAIIVFKQYYVQDPEDISKNVDFCKEYTCISLEEAKKFKVRAKIGQILNIPVNPKKFNFYAAKDFKNKFNEELIKQQRENVYNYFKAQQNQIINAKIIDVNDKFYRLELEKDMITLLPKKEALTKDLFYQNDRIQVYLVYVQKTTKLPKILVSRIHIGFVLKTFESQISEIYDGTVTIVNLARIPGERVKIGLCSHDPQVDPVGSCIGEKGYRIKSIMQLLQGEKIDLFLWSEKVEELITNALQPAKILEIKCLDYENRIALAIVADDQFSVAIGRNGNNVKLAVQVTQWKIDVKAISDLKDQS